MGNLFKTLIVLAIIVGAIALAVRYGSNSDEDAGELETARKTEVPQVQEKYGFAPIGEE